ncbi:MAG: hypothetical protein LBE13_15015 [Bacteroidales bacterium]|jgi:predicted ATP-grasp superfamily ATP-dependent carboligase|nr:hypothetical protein [Bacteroidales bacterium]
MATKIVIVFSGFNQRAIVAFLRTLEKNKIDYAIIAKSLKDPIFNSIYKNKVFAIRKKEELCIEDIYSSVQTVKNQIITQHYLIAPSTEALNRFLLENRDLFEKENIVIPLVDRDLYGKVSDKYAFGLMCKKYGITIPEEKIGFEEMEVPFVAKPYRYFNGEQKVLIPQLIFSKTQKEEFRNQYNIDDFYFQKFIDGKSFYLLFYVNERGVIYKYSQENIAQQPDGKSIVAAKSSTIHLSKISEKYERMLIDICFRGMIMIEIKRQGDTFYMIEANPRFWGPSQLFVDSNMNFFEIFLYDYGIIQNMPDFSEPIESKYFWHGGIIETKIKHKQITIHSQEYLLFENNIDEWLKSDVYKREDTINIYNKELLQ